MKKNTFTQNNLNVINHTFKRNESHFILPDDSILLNKKNSLK
jgi:hypothetical protein